MAARKSVVEKYRAANVVDPTLTHIMIHKNGYWGKGETEAEALKAYNSIVTPPKIESDMMVWLCTPGARINEHGGVARPKDDHEPIRIQ